MLDRSPGDDHSVVESAPDIVKRLIKLQQMLDGRILGHIGRRIHQVDVDLKRRVRQRPKKLCFRRDFVGHEIEDQDPDRPDILSKRPIFGHYKYMLALKDLGRGKIVLDSNWHNGTKPLSQSDYASLYEDVKKAMLSKSTGQS
jgi:hypothetical protein